MLVPSTLRAFLVVTALVRNAKPDVTKMVDCLNHSDYNGINGTLQTYLRHLLLVLLACVQPKL